MCLVFTFTISVFVTPQKKRTLRIPFLLYLESSLTVDQTEFLSDSENNNRLRGESIILNHKFEFFTDMWKDCFELVCGTLWPKY